MSPTRPPNGRRRDRHGRGVRGPLLARTVQVTGKDVRVPAAQTRGERFDGLVLDAVEELEQRWAAELQGVEFAVEDVPGLADVPPEVYAELEPDPELVVDETAGGAVPLGRLLPPGIDAQGRRTPARLVVYRRPLEVRAVDRVDLAELAHDVVVDLIARLLDLDPDEVDPPQE